MILLISQDRPADQKYNLSHSIKGEKLFKLTTIDMKIALINEMLENPRSKTTPRTLKSKLIACKSMITSPSSSIHLEPTAFKKGTTPDDPPQHVDKSHLSSITNLDVTCSLDTSCDHLLHLESPSHSSEPQDTSSVQSVEVEFFPEIEGQLDYANL